MSATPESSRASYDPKYEFDAPTFRDFTKESPANEKADDWFGKFIVLLS